MRSRDRDGIPILGSLWTMKKYVATHGWHTDDPILQGDNYLFLDCKLQNYPRRLKLSSYVEVPLKAAFIYLGNFDNRFYKFLWNDQIIYGVIARIDKWMRPLQ